MSLGKLLKIKIPSITKEQKERGFTVEEFKKISKGSHRVTDFIIYPCSSILFRDPYSFIYLEDDVIHHSLSYRNTTNSLGYCPCMTQFGVSFLLSSAKSYLIGNKYDKRNYKFSMDLWKKKKKKSAMKKPEKPAPYYPIAKNTHFVIEIEGLGMFYFQMVYRRKKRRGND